MLDDKQLVEALRKMKREDEDRYGLLGNTRANTLTEAIERIQDNNNTTGLREALQFLNKYSNVLEINTEETPFFVATNALLREIGNREGKDIKTLLEEGIGGETRAT